MQEPEELAPSSGHFPQKPGGLGTILAHSGRRRSIRCETWAVRLPTSWLSGQPIIRVARVARQRINARACDHLDTVIFRIILWPRCQAPVCDFNTSRLPGCYPD